MLTKPGIIFGNLITTTAGFLLASRWHFNLSLFIATALGLGCVIGSACVLNNYIDRKVDIKMERTKNRALAAGLLSLRSAAIFATFLGALGAFLLFVYTNALSAVIAMIGFCFYVVMYSFWKYYSSYGTLVGSIAGAIPPVVGYCAVTNTLDLGAFLIFLILVLWQMPHFYAITIYRLDDYKAAAIPVLPVKHGIHRTKIHMLYFILAFIPAAASLTFFGYTGRLYLLIVIPASLIWLALAIQGFKTPKSHQWAYQMFRYSLVLIMIISLMMAIDVR
jgi:protoheme IX farnesyltransferase